MKSLFLVLFYFFSALVYSQTKELRITYKDTTISYPLFYKRIDSISNNKLEAYFASDTSVLAVVKNFYNGKQNGVYKEFYPSGKTYIFSVYQQGKLHGDWTKYNEAGKIDIKAKYINGIKHGFYTDKKNRFQGRYSHGEKNGKWEYNLNSTSYYKRYYSRGELLNKRKILPSLGLKDSKTEDNDEIQIEEKFKEKELDTIRIEYPTETKYYVVRYVSRDSIEHPTMRKAVYRDSTRNTAIIKYIYEGNLSGNYKLYFPNGRLYKHWVYSYGVLNGAYKEYNLQGRLVSTGKYKNGKKHGKWKYNIGYDKNYIEVYKEDKLIKSTKLD